MHLIALNKQELETNLRFSVLTIRNLGHEGQKTKRTFGKVDIIKLTPVMQFWLINKETKHLAVNDNQNTTNKVIAQMVWLICRLILIQLLPLWVNEKVDKEL